jgi:retinol-binding protein 3
MFAFPNRYARYAAYAISLGVVVSAEPARAQAQRDTVTPVSDAELARLVDTLVFRLRTTYLDTAIGRRMSEVVRRGQIAGHYSRLVSPLMLADSITAQLRRVSGDSHMRVRYRQYGATAPSVVGDSVDRAKRRERYLRDARWDNFGFDAVRVFPGSVGYVELHEFMDPQFAGSTLSASMEFVRHSRAIIIDLRRNGGGYERLIQLVTAYFLERPTLLWTTSDRLNDRRAEAWSAPYAPGGRIDSNVPVYVLTSTRTFSAAEMFADVMKGSRRATIVGERTRGGGNFGDFLRLNSRFDVFIPYGTTVSAFTGRSLEKVGVTPDIEAPPDSALIVARTHALRRIRASLSDQELIDEVDAALKQLEREGR